MNLKTNLMKNYLLLIISILSIALNAQTQKTKILLLGTFHFENPGFDVAKYEGFNVMTVERQKEMENISQKIKAFAPDKIFVEWSYKDQAGLNKLYAKNIDSLLKINADERIQLGMRTAKKLKHKQLYAIDYNETTFAYDLLMKSMEMAGQKELIKASDNEMKQHEQSQNLKRKTYTLTQLILDLNSKESNASNLGWYLTIANRAGANDVFVGANLVSEWYKRNLHMYSLVQKLTAANDKSIVLLAGSGHTAIIRELVKNDARFELVEVEEVLK